MIWQQSSFVPVLVPLDSRRKLIYYQFFRKTFILINVVKFAGDNNYAHKVFKFVRYLACGFFKKKLKKCRFYNIEF